MTRRVVGKMRMLLIYADRRTLRVFSKYYWSTAPEYLQDVFFNNLGCVIV